MFACNFARCLVRACVLLCFLGLGVFQTQHSFQIGSARFRSAPPPRMLSMTVLLSVFGFDWCLCSVANSTTRDWPRRSAVTSWEMSSRGMSSRSWGAATSRVSQWSRVFSLKAVCSSSCTEVRRPIRVTVTCCRLVWTRYTSPRCPSRATSAEWGWRSSLMGSVWSCKGLACASVTILACCRRGLLLQGAREAQRGAEAQVREGVHR